MPSRGRRRRGGKGRKGEGGLATFVGVSRVGLRHDGVPDADRLVDPGRVGRGVGSDGGGVRGVLALLAFPTLVLVVSAGTLGQTTPTAAAEVDALTGSFRMALLEAREKGRAVN